MEKELAFPQFVPLHIGFWEHHADWNFDNINSPFFRIYLVMKGGAKVITNTHRPLRRRLQSLLHSYLRDNGRPALQRL